ncbi:MAG: Hydrogenase isoenzymes nickel incorporation protein HypB [Actinobacteria bacterium ADurb.Bin346]|nr:MAG: Hydrogenase isoenzymes nickel incorporation protein HypB [Actinobacteria bacterium ADurb.Bin346]
MKIDIIENVMQYNSQEADLNRELFFNKKIFVINILSAPGAGKTSFIIENIKKLKGKIRTGVIEGDISSTHDSEKIKKYIENVVQINTGGTCHLNASMVAKAVEKINLSEIDLLFIENVGNLICPVGFDLGEDYRILLSSVSEGDDKPVKYPKAFVKTDMVILNKKDMMPYSDFNYCFFESKVKELNKSAGLITISCKTGEGIDYWLEILSSLIEAKKQNDLQL